MVSSISCIVPTCQIYQDDSAGTLWSRTHTSKLAQCMCDRGVTWFSAWCMTFRSSSPAYVCKTELCQSNAGHPLCCHKESIMHPRWTNASTTSTCPSATWTVELEVEEGTCRILVFDQSIWRPKVDVSSCIFMVWWFTLKEEKCRDQRIIGTETISVLIKNGTLRWSLQVESKDEADSSIAWRCRK